MHELANSTAEAFPTSVAERFGECDFLLFQESGCAASLVNARYVVYGGGQRRGNCIWVHSRLAHFVRHSAHSQAGLLVVLALQDVDLCLLSMHLPTRDSGDDLYESAISDIMGLLEAARRPQVPLSVVVGVDANTQLPPCLDHVTGSSTTGVGLGLQEVLFLDFAMEIEGRALNSFPELDKGTSNLACWTHVLHGHEDIRRQIDFVDKFSTKK